MSKRAKKEKRPVAKIDFKPYGAAIKAGRTKQKESRNKAADALFISPRYLANIENNRQTFSKEKRHEPPVHSVPYTVFNFLPRCPSLRPATLARLL